MERGHEGESQVKMKNFQYRQHDNVKNVQLSLYIS